MRNIIGSLGCLLYSLHIMAQVPVSQEPRHHLVFENGKVRILNVLVPPGDTTQYHVHSTPSVFICFTKTRTGSQRKNQQAEFSTSVAGNIWFEDLSEPHTKVHRVWNMDTSVFHVMDVELLSKNMRSVKISPAIPNAQIQIDTSSTRTYTIHLAKKESVNIVGQPYDFILVATNDSKIKLVENSKEITSFIKAGWFYWINAYDKISFFNLGDSNANFGIVGIK